jgi:hypothetical protein
MDRYGRRTFEVSTTRIIVDGADVFRSEDLGGSRYSIVGDDGSA